MKKVTLTLFALATLGTPFLSLPQIANAIEIEIEGHRFSIHNGHRRAKNYSVFYRRHHRDSWRFYGSYSDRFVAWDVVSMLEDRGYYAYAVNQ
jgi:hypothetical protein